MEFKYKNIIDHLNNYNQLFLKNQNNSYIFNYFLRKRYLPLRFAYLKKIKTLSSFPKVIKYFDLPYIFPSQKDYLWRYNAIPYGAFFDKSRKNFLYFYSMGLKKNIGILAPFFVNYTNPQDHLHTSNWIESSFLFSKSLTGKSDLFHITKNFYTTSNLISLAFQIKNKKFHRIINSSQIDINPWLTTFDSRFITYDISSYNYKPNNLSKIDYVWGVNNHFICPSFFIDSFDTKIVLYTELYFKFKDKSYKFNKLFEKKNFFFHQSSYNFYYNIINILENVYKKKINFKYQNIKILGYTNLLFMLLFLFFRFFKNKENKYSFFKPSIIKKTFLLKNYFYGKVRKTQYRKISVLKFRLYYYKKLPSFLKIRNRSNLYPHFFLRTIVYRYSLKFLVKKISLYLQNFFIFFLHNLKNRFLNYFIYDNSILFIKELLFVIKRYFILTKILEKNKNKFNVNRHIAKVIKKKKKLMEISLLMLIN